MSDAPVSARDAILAAVREARPPAVARPEPLARSARASSRLSRRDVFVAAAMAAGAVVVPVPREDVGRIVAGAIGDAASVLSYAEGVSSTIALPSDPHQLDALDVLVCESSLGVAENGAVWIATEDSIFRGALFLAARVVIVVSDAQLVGDLHEAYERIDLRVRPFGVFIAGPSKTADIEQALVVGAHGPKELTLLLAGEAP